MTHQLSDDALALLASDAVATIVTLDPDGTPHLGPEVVFPAMPSPPPGFVTRTRVERVAGIGPWRR